MADARIPAALPRGVCDTSRLVLSNILCRRNRLDWSALRVGSKADARDSPTCTLANHLGNEDQSDADGVYTAR